MKSSIMGMVAVAALSTLALAGCSAAGPGSSDSSSSGGATSAAGKRACVILPDTESSPRWESGDRPALLKALKAGGFTADIQNAQNDTEKYATIADQQLSKGCGIEVRPHPIFRREGADLHMDLPVSLPDAVLGAKVEAPTPDGEVALRVAPHTSSGAMLRLKGRGSVDGPTGRRGDLYARVMITLPETPDPELDAFAETLRRERPYTPRRRG